METSSSVGAGGSVAGGAGGLAARLGDEVVRRLIGRITQAGGSREWIEVRAPFTGERLAAIPRGTADDVREAVDRARRAQARWAGVDHGARARPFLRFHDLLLERQDEVLDLIQLETGKARVHAFEEVADAAIVARHYARRAGEYLRPRRRRGAVPGLTTTWELRHPVGVVGVIAPWNYPLSLAVTDTIPALLAGNAAILKPDRQTSLTALWVVDLLQEAGLPADLFQVVTGEGEEVGAALVDAVDYVAFTGSTATGRVVARRAAERLIGSSLELGGKNPMIVLADADLDRAVDGAVRGCFANAGQLCISIERLYLEAPIHDAFVERFVERTRRLRLGASLDYDADVGSLVSAKQLAAVEAHVRDAVEKGATVLAGGRARPDLGPYFYEPTILTGVTEAMRVHSEETFGPVVSVYRVESAEEAVERANASRYGLNASLWTRDARLGRRLAARLEAGTVNVNEVYSAAWASVDAPMGGLKESGLGRRHGEEGILKYTEPQTVAVQRWAPLALPTRFDAGRASRVASAALRLLRWLPGV